MGKSRKRSIDAVDSYESDFVSDDEERAPRSKKTKSHMTDVKGKDDAENKFWELSSGRTPRRVEISEFKNAKLVNIREFYEKDEKWLPGKKGISLTVEQYKALLKAIPEINAGLRQRGISVDDSKEADRDDSEPAMKPQKRIKKVGKSNIEATSDEDGE